MDSSPNIPTSAEEPIRVGSSLGDLANVSHQKGDVDLITTSKDKIELILSATGSLGSNFMFFMLGAALSIILALKSGGVEASWRPIFWIGLVVSLIMAVFFGAFTANQEIQKHRFRKELRTKKEPTS